MTDANQTSTDLDSLVAQGASEWRIDPSASSVEFHVKHFWGKHTLWCIPRNDAKKMLLVGRAQRI